MPEFLSEKEERQLIDRIEAFAPDDWGKVELHGVASRRSVLHFGHEYAFPRRALGPGRGIPLFLKKIRDRAATQAGEDPKEFVEALFTKYPPGAGIGWHRDAPPFGSTVIGISLGSPCTMKFRRQQAHQKIQTEIVLEPRSLYVISGIARWAWQHSIPPVRELRYSITFRTLA